MTSRLTRELRRPPASSETDYPRVPARHAEPSRAERVNATCESRERVRALTFADDALGVHACAPAARALRFFILLVSRSVSQSVFLLPRERVDRPVCSAFSVTIYGDVFRDAPTAGGTMSLGPGAIKHRATRRALTLAICIILEVVVHASPAEPLPSTLLDGIGNVANSATNFRESIPISSESALSWTFKTLRGL